MANIQAQIREDKENGGWEWRVVDIANRDFEIASGPTRTEREEEGFKPLDKAAAAEAAQSVASNNQDHGWEKV